AHDAGRGGALAVRGDRHELKLHGRTVPAQRAGEVGHEHERALEYADQQDRLRGRVVGGHLLGQVFGLFLDLFLGHDHAVDVGGVPGALGHADKGAAWPWAADDRVLQTVQRTLRKPPTVGRQSALSRLSAVRPSADARPNSAKKTRSTSSAMYSASGARPRADSGRIATPHRFTASFALGPVSKCSVEPRRGPDG